jgi:LuxR family maltose regulon positive regulatory protein
LAARGVEAEYLGRVLAAFPPTTGATDAAQQIRRAAQAHLIEPLTERESEVLLYLKQGLSNKAIARTLDISALTVKKHTIHLYQKLGINSRQQAIARAKSLGILPTTDAYAQTS